MITNPKYKEELTMNQFPMFQLRDEEMEKNIGKIVTFKNPEYPSQRGELKIGSIQRIYDGSKAYRVHSDLNPFGRPVRPEEIDFKEDV